MRTRVDRGTAVTLVDDTEIEALPALPALAGTFSVGDVVDRRYRILRLVRESGSTRIFCGKNVVTGARVWIEHWLRHPERFAARARALASVRHRNVMRLVDALADPAILVLELPQAVPLQHLIRAEGRIDPARALRIAERVCWAADALHAAGIVGVELSSSVVTIAPDSETGEEPVLFDASQATSDGHAGRLLLHMLTGREPASDVDPAAAVAELRASLPRVVARFVGDLLARRSPLTPREQAEALHALRRRLARIGSGTRRGGAWIAAAIVAAALSLLVGRSLARALAPHDPGRISVTSGCDR